MSDDEREEGEIVDDDFETVSDSPMDICSLSPPPPPDISDLQALNNVSDESSPPPTPKNHKKRRRKRKSDPKIAHKKRSSSSDSEHEWVDSTYARQLHKALKHETPTNILHRSLRTRLKPLMKEKQEYGAQDESEELRDMELIELRMAALRSVVLTNDERQKRKADGSCGKEDSTGSNGEGAKGEIELDKENNLSVINGGKRVRQDSGPKSSPDAAVNGSAKTPSPITSTPKPHSDNVDSSQDDEDADILRAMLLASMSRKITRKPATAPASTKKKVELRPQNSVITKVITKPNRQLIKSQPKLPSSSITVKPLIINLKDSDSDSEAATAQKNMIKNNVAAFLKQQRAEVEKAALSDSPFLDKSALKLLPKSQQLEYRKLKQKLLIAAKKNTNTVATVPHVVCGEIQQTNKVPTKKLNNLSPIKRRYSVVNPNKLVMNKNPAPKQNVSKLVMKPAPKQNIAKLAVINSAKLNHLAKLNNNRKLSSEKIVTTSTSKGTVTDTDTTVTVDSQTSESSKDDQGKKSLYHIVSMLRKILTELQIKGRARRNGRMLTKGKYQELEPLLQRMNKASMERRTVELELKQQVKRVEHLRTNLAGALAKFSGLVEELSATKAMIDAREKLLPLALSSTILEEPTTENNSSQTYSKTDLASASDSDREFATNSTPVPKYVSPLNKGSDLSDPLATLCPYDLQGVCKDKQCPYKHCPA